MNRRCWSTLFYVLHPLWCLFYKLCAGSLTMSQHNQPTLKLRKLEKTLQLVALFHFFLFIFFCCLSVYSLTALFITSVSTPKKTSHLISKSVSSGSLIVNRAPLLCLCLPACCLCVSECVCFRVSGLIISDRDVIGVWQSFICHNWHLHPITFSCFFCFFCNLPSAGICGVSRRIHCSGLGIQRIQTRPQQLRQVERRKELCAISSTGREEKGKKTREEAWFFFCCCFFILKAFSRLRCQIQRSEGRSVSTGFIRRSPVKKRTNMEKARDAERLDKSPRTVSSWMKKKNNWIKALNGVEYVADFHINSFHILLPQPTRPI